MRQQFVYWCGLVAVCVFAIGCDSGQKTPAPRQGDKSGPNAEEQTAATSDTTAKGPSGSETASSDEAPQSKPEQPFNPPTLEELDKSVQWEDRPVKEMLALLTEHLAKNPPQVSVRDALAMKNNNAEDNSKILGALDRQPESKEQVQWNGQMTRHLLGDINSTNAIMLNSTHEFDVFPIIHVELFTYDWDLQLYGDGDTIVKWQSSKDRMYDKVEMRKDCMWSDGKPITAHDVEFTFRAIMNTKIPVPAVRSSVEKLQSVKAYGDHLVVFFHKQPLATNEWNMEFQLIPQHVYEPLYSQLDTISFPELQQKPEFQAAENGPVTGGPYKIVRRTRNQEILCKRRDEWYMHGGKQVRAKPFFEEVRFRVIEDPNTALLALMSGGIDDFEIHMEQWANQTNGEDFYEKNTKVRATEWLYWGFFWNNNSDTAPFFKDRRVREAMSYAFDYDELLKKLLYNLCEPCAGIFYPTSWMAPKQPLKPYHQDQDKAVELLDEAGWVDSDGDGIRDKEVGGRSVPFEFSMLVRQDPERIRICELMKFNLEQIGVRCNIQPIEATVFFERTMKKQFQAYYGGWGSGTDPDTSDNIWMTKAIADGRNFLSYSNPKVDRLYEEGRAELDRAKRAAIYAQIDEIIFHDQPCTFLFWRNAFYGFNKRLRGYYFSPRGPFHFRPGFQSIWSVQ